MSWLRKHNPAMRAAFNVPDTHVIRCFTCLGSGQITWNIDKNILIDCPPCFGAGERIIKAVPGRHQECPQCRCMGFIMLKDQSRHLCKSCGGGGVVKQL